MTPSSWVGGPPNPLSASCPAGFTPLVAEPPRDATLKGAFAVNLPAVGQMRGKVAQSLTPGIVTFDMAFDYLDNIAGKSKIPS